MTKIMKKVSGLALALAMVFTMMPSMVFAEPEGGAPDLKIYFNPGVSYSAKTNLPEEAKSFATVYSDWMTDPTNWTDPQIVPRASRNANGTISYTIVQGVPVDKVLEKVGIDSDLSSAYFKEYAGIVATNGFGLSGDQLAKATKVYALNSDKAGEAAAAGTDMRTLVDGAEVTPVLATKVGETYPSYTEAQAALDTAELTETNGYPIYIGNAWDGEAGSEYAYTYEDEAINMGTPDLVSKYTTEGGTSLAIFGENIEPIILDKAELTLNPGEKYQLRVQNEDLDQTDITQAINWESSNQVVATVSVNNKKPPKAQSNGTVVGAKAGKTTITVEKDGYVSGTCEVTVTDKMADFAVTINGETFATVSGEWIKANCDNYQIVPYAIPQNADTAKVKFVAAKGFFLEDALIEAGLINESMTELTEIGAKVSFPSFDGFAGNAFSFDQLANATKVYKGGITGEAQDQDSREDTGLSVKPMIAVSVSAAQAELEDAQFLLEAKEWGEENFTGPYENWMGQVWDGTADSPYAYKYKDGTFAPEGEQGPDFPAKYRTTACKGINITMDASAVDGYADKFAEAYTAEVIGALDSKTIDAAISDAQKAITVLENTADASAEATKTIYKTAYAITDKAADISAKKAAELAQELADAKTFTVKTSATYKTAAVTLPTVDGINGYYVNDVKKASGSKVTVSAKTGATTKFKVNAYITVDGKEYVGAAKTVSVKSVLAKASVKKLTAGKKYLKVTFGKVTGATKYQVQYKTGTSVKTVTTTTTSKTIKSLKSGKKYTVKVRALTSKNTVNGKTQYGAWSTAKTVKVK